MTEHEPSTPAPATPPDRQRLRRWIAVDILMMAVLLINLTVLVMELLYRSDVVRQALQAHLPGVAALYDRTVHANFVAIDLGFVAIYLVELVARWITAIRQSLYERWFAYPLVHWYDTLGLIPVGSLRFLRLLRIVTIVVRLHRLGLIDVRKTWLYGVLRRYKNILTEEVSDRVVVRVLEGVQAEVSAPGTPVMQRLWTEVLGPRRDEVLEAVTTQATHRIKETLRLHRADIRRYVDGLLADALQRSRLVPLESMPVLGARLSREVEHIVRGVIENVVDRLLEQAGALDERVLLQQVKEAPARILSWREDHVRETVRQMTLESLEIIKDQVRIKQWQLAEQELRAGPGGPDRPAGEQPALPPPDRAARPRRPPEPATSH